MPSLRLFFLFSALSLAMERVGDSIRATSDDHSCLGKPVPSAKMGSKGTTKLVVLRENLQGQAQILLKGVGTHGDNASGAEDDEPAVKRKEKEGGKKRIKIVVDSRFRLPVVSDGEDALKVISGLLKDYQFGQPCIYAGRLKDVIVVADPANGFFAQPSPPYEWVRLRQVLEGGPVKLIDDLAEADLDWEYIFSSLNFLPLNPEGGGDGEEEEEAVNGFPECRYSSELLRNEEHHGKVVPITLLAFRIGPFGKPEVLLQRSKAFHRLLFPGAERSKSSMIEKSLGLRLLPKAPILKKKCHLGDESLVVVLCRVDPALDGFGSASFVHDEEAFLWRSFATSMDASAGRVSDVRHCTSTDRLEVSTVAILQELDGHFGGASGWKRIFKALGVSQKTSAQHPYHSPYHHQHHDHHHLHAHHHHPHHLHMTMHHHQHHGCHGKQYLAALWNGTQMQLLSRTPFKGKITALGHEKAIEAEQALGEWQVLTASDLVDVVRDLKLAATDRVLVVTMQNLENPQSLLRGGVDSLSSRLCIRTNLMQGVERLDRRIRAESPRSVFLLRGVEVIRAGEGKGYEFRGEVHLGGRLDVAIVGRFSHVDRHHGSLDEDAMALLIAKLEDVFACVAQRRYGHVLVSVGGYEWEGIPTHVLLLALRAAARGLGGGAGQPILVLDRCFDERDREDAQSALNSKSL